MAWRFTSTWGDTLPDVHSVDIRPFTAVEATCVSRWSYEAPFDVYDGDPRAADAYLDVDEAGFGYYVIVAVEDIEPIGFCCFGSEARVPGQQRVEGVVDVGGGLRPDLLSRGVATRVFPEVIAFAERRFTPNGLRTAVATFNARSLRLCEAAGFVRVRAIAVSDREFQELMRPVSVGPAR